MITVESKLISRTNNGFVTYRVDDTYELYWNDNYLQDFNPRFMKEFKNGVLISSKNISSNVDDFTFYNNRGELVLCTENLRYKKPINSLSLQIEDEYLDLLVVYADQTSRNYYFSVHSRTPNIQTSTIKKHQPFNPKSPAERVDIRTSSKIGVQNFNGSSFLVFYDSNKHIKLNPSDCFQLYTNGIVVSSADGRYKAFYNNQGKQIFGTMQKQDEFIYLHVLNGYVVLTIDKVVGEQTKHIIHECKDVETGECIETGKHLSDLSC